MFAATEPEDRHSPRHAAVRLGDRQVALVHRASRQVGQLRVHRLAGPRPQHMVAVPAIGQDVRRAHHRICRARYSIGNPGAGSAELVRSRRGERSCCCRRAEVGCRLSRLRDSGGLRRRAESQLRERRNRGCPVPVFNCRRARHDDRPTRGGLRWVQGVNGMMGGSFRERTPLATAPRRSKGSCQTEPTSATACPSTTSRQALPSACRPPPNVPT